ncbi:hypothetical protein [Hyphomonas sp.]|uniref:hypothetical protein n=1 Tax=Hyphomonas sp. TaxID=87 RepID=UPI0025BFEB83|nr:hypothetical protein [Hyphomonas sp.]
MARSVIRLDVGIIRHFWEGGENAVWRSSGRLPPEIVRQVKDDYPLLMISRPVQRRYGEYEAAFDYQDELDKFGRPAPAFTAAVYQHGDDPTRLAAVSDFAFPVSPETPLDLSFEHASVSAPKVSRPRTLAVKEQQRSEEVRVKRFPKVWFAVGVFALAAVCGAGALVYTKFGAENDSSPLGRVSSKSGVDGSGLGHGEPEVEKGLNDLCIQLRAPDNASPVANCAMQYAFSYCHEPAPSKRGWENVQQVTTGYCGAYARLQEQEFLGALSGDLYEADFLSTWSKQALHDDLFRLPDTVPLVPVRTLTEGGNERRLPNVHRTREEPPPPAGPLPDLGRLLGRKDDAGLENRRLIELWNDALGGDRLGRHRMMLGQDAASVFRAYASDYCSVRAPLDARKREFERTGFEDPLLQAVSQAIATKAGENATVACAGDSAKVPADIARIMGIEDERTAIRALVEVVDFCPLVSWESLGEQGVSRLVRSCEDAAETLGVPW